MVTLRVRLNLLVPPELQMLLEKQKPLELPEQQVRRKRPV